MTYHLSPQNSSRCWTITDYSTKLSGKRTTLTAEFAKHGKKLRQLASLPASGPPAISAPMTNPTARPERIRATHSPATTTVPADA